jgi:hypothetical protein
LKNKRIASIVDVNLDIAELFHESLNVSLISPVFGLDISFGETYGTVDDIAMADRDFSSGACISGTDECYGPYNNDVGKCHVYYGNYSFAQYVIITQYCINHAEKIQMDKNLVKDLIDSSSIPYRFNNKTYTDVSTEENNNGDFLNLVSSQ